MSNITKIANSLLVLAEDSSTIAKELDEAREAYQACGETGPCPEWDRYKKALKAARKAGVLTWQRNKDKNV